MPSTGQARFKCSYTAIVMKPFKGEVADGKVTQVNKMGFFADIGPLQVFVSSHVSTRSTPFSFVMSKMHRDNRPSGMLSMPGDLVVIDHTFSDPPTFSFLRKVCADEI